MTNRQRVKFIFTWFRRPNNALRNPGETEAEVEEDTYIAITILFLLVDQKTNTKSILNNTVINFTTAKAY